MCLFRCVVCIYTPRWQLGGWRGPTTYQHQQMDHNSPSGKRKEGLHLTATVFQVGFILFTVVIRYVTVLLIHFCVLSSGCNAYQIPVLMICPAVRGNYSWMQQGWRLCDCSYCVRCMTWAPHLSFQCPGRQILKVPLHCQVQSGPTEGPHLCGNLPSIAEVLRLQLKRYERLRCIQNAGAEKVN